MADRAQATADALLRVFAMFKLTPEDVIKIGSFAHLVTMFGADEADFDDGLDYLLEHDLLVPEADCDLYLTEKGYRRMIEIEE